MAFDSADLAPVSKEKVQGADEGAVKLASAFRKKKKQAPPMKAGGKC